MNCPKCGKPSLIVVDSRDREENTVIVRRRKCSRCQERFTTTETLGYPPKEKRFETVVNTAIEIKSMADKVIRATRQIEGEVR